MALDLLGAKPIHNWENDDSDDAKRFRRWYNTIARNILVAHEWEDAVETIYLTYESNDDNLWDDKYEYIYDIPSDCLKALDIALDEELERFVEGSHLYCSFNDPTNEELTVASVTSNSIVCAENIDEDVLDANKVRVLIDSSDDEWKTYSYTSWATKTFSGVTPDPSADVTAGDELNAPTEGIPFRYIKDIRDESSSVVQYGEHVALAIAAELAVMIAPAHEKNAAELRDLRIYAGTVLSDAILADSSGRHSVPPREESWT
jgi:hypothetical protein